MVWSRSFGAGIPSRFFQGVVLLPLSCSLSLDWSTGWKKVRGCVLACRSIGFLQEVGGLVSRLLDFSPVGPLMEVFSVFSFFLTFQGKEGWWRLSVQVSGFGSGEPFTRKSTISSVDG